MKRRSFLRAFLMGSSAAIFSATGWLMGTRTLTMEPPPPPWPCTVLCRWFQICSYGASCPIGAKCFITNYWEYAISSSCPMEDCEEITYGPCGSCTGCPTN